MMTMLRNTLCLLFLVVQSIGWSQEVWMHPNLGQWDEEILYAVDLSDGHLYVDNKGFTYSLNDANASHNHDDKAHDDEKISCQVIKSHFIGSNWQGIKKEKRQSPFYRNYYLGSDSAKWKSGIHSVPQAHQTEVCSKVMHKDLWIV